jgi:hypothetical protein
MRKKVLMFLGAAAVLAVVLSVTAFAETSDPAIETLTDYNLVEVLRQSIEMIMTTLFTVADKIYQLFGGLFG